MLIIFMQVCYNDLKFYEECIDFDGLVMMYLMFVIGWLELGEKKKVEKFFFKNYENICGLFKVRLLLVYCFSNSIVIG